MPFLRVLPVGNPLSYNELLRTNLPGSIEFSFETLPAVPFSEEMPLAGRVDIVLFAWSAVCDGCIERLNQILQVPEAPVVIVLAKDYDEGVAVACLRLGVQDCLWLEGLTPKALVRAMIHAWERVEMGRKPNPLIHESSVNCGEIVPEVNQLLLRMKEEAAERVRAEKALVETVAHFRFLLDSLPQIVWTADTNGALVYLNHFWVQYSGRTVEEKLSVGWGESIHPDDRALTEERWRRSLLTGEPLEIEHRLLGADGSYRWHQSRAVLRRSAVGKILEWIGTEAYIDDQKRVEERLKEAHDDLGIRILERTSELAHANELLQAEVGERRYAEMESRKAREVAEAANRSKTEFLANISHEIRTPMNGIIGMTELTLDTPLDDQQREYLQLVAQSADSLLTLINDMLDFAKIEAGKLELASEAFALRDVFQDAIKALSVRADQKGLQLLVEVSPDVPRKMVGDPLRIRQVILNLLGNAIKFTEKGKISATVRAVSSHGGQVNLLFEISDTGIGIPEDKQQLIFEAFAQVDGSMTRRYGGSGLGLAIVSSLVKQMGGDIRVQSKLGEGSTFSFNLPIAVDGQSEISIAAPVLSAEFQRYIGLRVMVAGEGPEAKESELAKILESLRLKPEVVGFGAEAFCEMECAQSQERPYELVIADARLGDMSGTEFVQALAERKELNKVPVILLLSGSTSPDDVKRAHAAGADQILYKPVVQADLVNAITHSLGIEDPNAASETQEREPAASPAKAKLSLRVLVAEDNPVNQLVAERILMSFGCTVVKVSNGRDAVETVARDAFDLILMDIQMPEMDGMEATRLIRSLPGERSRVPIVAMTAHAMKGDRERFLASGMDHYISKPFHKDELYFLVKSLRSLSVAQPKENSESGNPTKVLLDRLLTAMGGDKALFRGACDLFEELTPGLIEELSAAIQGEQTAAAERLARNLKASLDSVGARESSEQVTVLEANLRSRDYPGALALLEKIQSDVREILVETAGIRNSASKV